MIPADASTIALVDDDDDLRGAVAQILEIAGHRVLSFSAARPALAAIGADFPGVVLSDVRMPGMDGMEMFRAVRARDPELPVLLMTGHGDVAMAVQALKDGAWDFISKPFDPEALVAAVGRAMAHRSLGLDNRRLRALAGSAGEFALVGRSPAIEQLRGMVTALAGAQVDIFIEGETGTGKKLLARLIHQAGGRSRGRFVAIPCPAIQEAAIEGTFSTTRGVVEADRGTLFLNGIDGASTELQARLVQFCEERAVWPQGRHTAVPVDCRIIASGSEQSDGAIAPSLFYRLAAVRLRMPPLRERREDVLLLFAHLLEESAARVRRPVPALTGAVRRHLVEHPWPGNVRELAHFADQVLLGFAPAPNVVEAEAKTLPDRLALFEREAIITALRTANGEVGKAIRALGIPRKTFYYKVQRHGIDVAKLRRSSGQDSG